MLTPEQLAEIRDLAEKGYQEDPEQVLDLLDHISTLEKILVDMQDDSKAYQRGLESMGRMSWWH